VLTLNRPMRRNAIDNALTESLRRALADIDLDTAVHAVILCGAPPGFCAGSDIRELSELDVDGMGRHESGSGALARSIQELTKPVIAAVEGFAIGGGFLLATSCDLVVAADDSRWHLPETALGWVPPWGLRALTNRVGVAQARRLAWSLGVLDGVQAGALGIADEVVESGGAVTAARRLAQQLAALPASAVRSTKRVFANMDEGATRAADELANQLFVDDCRSDVAQAAIARFTSPTSRR
jgi:enoyl-CoA hydratase/carnithine racemase